MKRSGGPLERKEPLEYRQGSKRGFTLLECLVGMALVAGVFPLAVSALLFSQQAQTRARVEQQAAGMARQLFCEVPQAWQEGGTTFPGKASFPLLSAGRKEQVFLVSVSPQADVLPHEFRRVGSLAQRHERKEASMYLVHLRTDPVNARPSVSPTTTSVTLSVQYPAGKPPAARDVFQYKRTFRQP